MSDHTARGIAPRVPYLRSEWADVPFSEETTAGVGDRSGR